MRPLAVAVIAALAGGGAACAAPAPKVVANLVTSVCMPMIETGAFQPDSLPQGGRKLTATEKARLDMADDLGDWRYEADDDYVIVQVRSDNGCDVVTGTTGGPNFLPTLRAAVAARYSRPQSIHISPSDPAPDTSYISYWVDLPPGRPSGSPPALGLAVTYTKARAQTQKRTFYVGVIPATRKPN